nr:hypothetical protein [Pandoravirus massiliensis]
METRARRRWGSSFFLVQAKFFSFNGSDAPRLPRALCTRAKNAVGSPISRFVWPLSARQCNNLWVLGPLFAPGCGLFRSPQRRVTFFLLFHLLPHWAKRFSRLQESDLFFFFLREHGPVRKKRIGLCPAQ